VIGHLPSAFNLALAHLRDATSLWRFLTIRFEGYCTANCRNDGTSRDVKKPPVIRLGLALL
jgi:hypothetical protein